MNVKNLENDLGNDDDDDNETGNEHAHENANTGACHEKSVCPGRGGKISVKYGNATAYDLEHIQKDKKLTNGNRQE